MMGMDDTHHMHEKILGEVDFGESCAKKTGLGTVWRGEREASKKQV